MKRIQFNPKTQIVCDIVQFEKKKSRNECDNVVKVWNYKLKNNILFCMICVCEFTLNNALQTLQKID